MGHLRGADPKPYSFGGPGLAEACPETGTQPLSWGQGGWGCPHTSAFPSSSKAPQDHGFIPAFV